MRDDFSSRTRYVLAERVGYLCSNPDCRRPTIGPHSDPAQSLRVGRACHIRAAAPGGPRYDPTQSTHDRAALSNGIWLCAVCSDLIDKDETRYPVHVLNVWKTAAEDEAFRRLRSAQFAAVTGHFPPAPSDILAVNKHLDDAFDALAGAVWSSRITWRHVSDVALERAQRAVRDAEMLGVPSPTIVVLRAACLFARGFADRALEELQQSPTPDAFAHVLMRAVCLDTIGQTEESLHLLTKLAADPAAPPAVFYNIGRAHHHAGDSDRAMEAFRQALSADPQYVEAIEFLARIAYDRRDFGEATRLAAKAYDRMPGDEAMACNYALCLTEQKDYGTATAVLTPFLQKASPDVDVLQLLGRIAGELGNMSVAERLLRRVLDEVPTHPVALHNLGMVLLHTGRFEEAEQVFHSAKNAGYPEADDISDRVRAVREFFSHAQPEGGS